MNLKIFSFAVISMSTFVGFFCSSTQNDVKTKVERTDKLDHQISTIATKGGPKIFVEQPTFDFGEVPEGTEVTHVFEVTNKGTDTLVIKEVETSCGCTAAVIDISKIPPQGKSKIRSTFNSRGRPNFNEKLITVFSNDLDEPAKTLVIKGKVTPKK